MNDRPQLSRRLPAPDRFEWWQNDKMPHCITTRRQPMSDGTDAWVATRVGLYLSTEALRDKHDEILQAYPNACVIRFAISEFDWVTQAEKNGRKIL